MVINKHSDEKYNILVRLMEKFQSPTFCYHLQTIIDDANKTDEKKSKAGALLTMTCMKKVGRAARESTRCGKD
jgi:hypothetical protein